MKSLLMMLAIAAVSSCEQSKTADPPVKNTDKTILALGDSYTIGESVSRNESFPFQLTERLNADGITAARPKVIAQTGWTTSDLIRAVSSENINSKYDIVTLLIGVNNQYSGGSSEIYRKEFKELLNTAISYSKTGKTGVFVISFPDWTVTPFGKEQGFRGPSADVATFNEISRQETANQNIKFIDITVDSRKVEADRSLTASDGLHPSAKLYTHWVKALYPFVKQHLEVR